MSSTFNLSNLPIIPLEKVLTKISSREFIHLSSMANYQFTRKVTGFQLKINSDCARIMMEEFYHSWEPTDAVSEVTVKYQQLLKKFIGPLDTLEIQAELIGQLKNSAAISLSCRELILTCNGGNEHQESVDSLLGEMSMESLYFNVDGCEIKNDRIFSLDRLHIDSAAWMTPNDLLRCNNKFLHIGTHELADEAVNAFILKWFNGKDNRMEFALFDRSDMAQWDLEILLAGITARNFDGRVRDSFYIPPGVVPEYINESSSGDVNIDSVFWGLDMRDALDIQRADGTWASLEVGEGSNQLRFVVWNELWPTSIVIDKLREELDGLSDSYERKMEVKRKMEVNVCEKEKQAMTEDLEMLWERITRKRDRITTLCILLRF